MVDFDFTVASKIQLETIKQGLDHVSGDIWKELGREPFNIFVKKGKPTMVFLVRHEDISLIKKIENKKIIEHSGIYLGFIKEKEFFLGLEGAEFLFLNLNNKYNLNLKTITITEQAAESFLYGNNIRPEEFTRSPKILNRKDVIFVLNPSSIFLGIGYIFKYRVTEYDEERIELRNLVDYGYYIRRGF